MPDIHRYTRRAPAAPGAPPSLDRERRTVAAVLSSFAEVMRKGDRPDGSYGPWRERLDPAGVDTTREPLPLLADHWAATADIRGSIGDIRRAGAELVGVARIVAGPLGDQTLDLIESGGASLSIGYSVNDWRADAPAARDEPVFTATRWQLLEVSLVSIPADPAARFCSLESHTMTEPDAPDTNTTRAAPLDERSIRAERARITGITTSGRSTRAAPALIERLINEGTPLEAARAALLEDAVSRDNASRIDTLCATAVTGRREADFREAAIDALLIRNGVPVATPHPAARDLARTSLLSMAESLLSMRGQETRGSADQVLARAYTHTSGDFPQLLANIGEKALLTGYELEPASHRAWVRETELSDFKAVARVGLSDAPTLTNVPEGGEYSYGTFGERGETIQLATYGRLFSITRQCLINDDLGALTRIPQAFGASARRKEADMVYAILTTNANMQDGVALFHATHANLLTGAGSVLNVAGLDAARKAMRLQTAAQGAVLNVVPRYLIVPAALETAAEVLIASTTRVDQTNPGVPMPAFIRSLQLVVDPRLDAASATAWYLAADANQVDTIELARLAGQNGLFTETREGWNVDGTEFKARLDVGVKAIDWRGLLKSAGA